jgi:hypothetical protein
VSTEPGAAQSGPLIPRSAFAQISALLPPAMLFRTDYGQIPLKNFPQMAIDQIDSLHLIERLAYIVIIALCGFVFIRRKTVSPSDPVATLFWAVITTYFGLVLFAMALNEVSTSTFPAAASRRAYGYTEFCYWSAVFLTLYRVLQPSVVQAVDFRQYAWWPVAQNIAVILVLPGLICAVTNAWSPTLGLPRVNAWHLINQAKTAIASSLAPQGAAVTVGADDTKNDIYEAMTYIRDHTSPGEWVYSNIISDNQFWYLTNGRYSLTEGSVMYQIFDLQKRAANRLQSFRDFAISADRSIIAPYLVRYVLLYRPPACQTSSCYDYGFAYIPTNLNAFTANKLYEVAYSNPSFLVLRVE